MGRDGTALAGEPLRILVAEDNVVNRAVVERFLLDLHHLVQLAINGREAVEAYERGCFDLVLMDLQMPEMDGLEATALLRDRQSQTGRWVPIVALTACATEEDRSRCLAAGMTDFLTKPIQISDLQRVIVAWT
jgi:CheY-like chemotaxis protein